MNVMMLKEDGLTPLLTGLKSAVRRSLLEAMGQHMVESATRAFSMAALRPAPWAPRRGVEKHPLLRKTGTLWRSLRVVQATELSVTVGSDRRYAAIHQLGGQVPAMVIRPRAKKALFWPGAAHPMRKVRRPAVSIPARPFFPIVQGRLTVREERALREVVRLRVQGAGGRR